MLKQSPGQAKLSTAGFLSRIRRVALVGMSAAALLAAHATLERGTALLAAPASEPGASASQPEERRFAPLPSFAPLVDRVKGAVVSIRVREEPPPRWKTPFFRNPEMVTAQGSGFFISPDGYLVTNNHVVDQASDVKITTIAGKTYNARVVGTDPRTDLALLKADASEQFPYVKVSAEEPEVGDWVVAMGNPYGLGGTVTVGIISALGRNIGGSPYNDFLQIDAPVNKGNSGGPSFNEKGEVIGVNTAIFSPSGGSIGIAFAIPAETVEFVTRQLRERGYVTRGWLGVEIQPVTEDIADSLGLKDAAGALISAVQSDSPAAKGGLQAGDVVLRLNGQPVADARDLARKVAETQPGSEASLLIYRDGKENTVQLNLGELKDRETMKRTGNEPSAAPAGGILGMLVTPAGRLGTAPQGVEIVGVVPGSPADRSGLTPGDIILTVAGNQINNADDIERALGNARQQGKNHALALVQGAGGQQRYVTLPAS